jgi:hypothetical protein
MTQYYVHLGYDYYGYLIGSVWGTDPRSNYWLQYCMTTGPSGNVNSAAANFQFKTNDQLYFKIWDLSAYPSGTTLSQISVDASQSGIGVNMTTGAAFKSTDEPVGVVSNSNLGWALTNDKNYIAFTAITMGNATSSSPWGQCRFASSNTIGPMTITGTGNTSFKMSFRIRAGYNSDWKTYIGDPETTIGSGREIDT